MYSIDEAFLDLSLMGEAELHRWRSGASACCSLGRGAGVRGGSARQVAAANHAADVTATGGTVVRRTRRAGKSCWR